MKTVHMTFVTGNLDRGFGDWLIGKTDEDDLALARFYTGELSVAVPDELPDLFTAAIIAEVILSVEP